MVEWRAVRASYVQQPEKNNQLSPLSSLCDYLFFFPSGQSTHFISKKYIPNCLKIDENSVTWFFEHNNSYPKVYREVLERRILTSTDNSRTSHRRKLPYTSYSWITAYPTRNSKKKIHRISTWYTGLFGYIERKHTWKSIEVALYMYENRDFVWILVLFNGDLAYSFLPSKIRPSATESHQLRKEYVDLCNISISFSTSCRLARCALVGCK